MLSKSKRYSREDFPKGKAYKTGHFPWGSVFLYKSPSFKAGAIVSKKALKRAVDRNKAKRRAYGALETLKTKNLGILLRLRKEALTTPSKTFSSDIEGLI